MSLYLFSKRNKEFCSYFVKTFPYFVIKSWFALVLSLDFAQLFLLRYKKLVCPTFSYFVIKSWFNYNPRNFLLPQNHLAHNHPCNLPSYSTYHMPRVQHYHPLPLVLNNLLNFHLLLKN